MPSSWASDVAGPCSPAGRDLAAGLVPRSPGRSASRGLALHQRVPKANRGLVRPLVTLHLKLGHGSGGEVEAFRCSFEPLPASFGIVPVADVLAHREREAVPVEV